MKRPTPRESLMYGPSPLDSVAARFDDLRGDTAPLELRDPYRVLAATRTEEVPEVIRGAEAEARSGGWVAGFVAYEAAPAFDDALVVRTPHPDLPPAWFAAFHSAVPEPADRRGAYRMAPWRPEISEDSYGADVAAIQDLITIGDTYQG